MQFFIVYYDAADYALNRVGPFPSCDAAVDAAIEQHGMPADAVLPSEVLPADEVADWLPLVTVQ